MLSAWLRKVAYSVTAKRPRGRPRCRPTVEELENRVVPTALTLPASLSVVRGAVVTVPIMVNTLDDPANSNLGLSGGDFVVFFNPSVFTVLAADFSLGTLATNGSTVSGEGYSPTATNGWTLAVNLPTPGQINVDLANGGTGIVTDSASGSLVAINFHVSSTATFGSSPIDLAADTFGVSPVTELSDQLGHAYVLNPAPQDNVTSLNPFTYSGVGPGDSVVTVTGNLPPVANGAAWSITERALASDPTLSVAATGVLATDTDPQGLPLTAIAVTGPTHGAVTLNSDGSFNYAPAIGYVGPDSFTYMANDGLANSNIATVSLAVTARLSIPTNFTALPGSSVVVPVNIDDSDPSNPALGGLVGATVAIDYDPTVFTVGITDLRDGTAANSGWVFDPVVNSTTGQISITAETGVPITSTSGGSLFLITFHVNSTAPAGPSAINLVATNAPSGTTVTTQLSSLNGPLPLRPALSNTANVVGVDGSVLIESLPGFSISEPANVTAGNRFSFTVTATGTNGGLDAAYNGTVHFGSSDAQAVLPADSTLTAGVGVFTATLKTAGSQTIAATDSAFGGGTGSTVIVSAASATHFIMETPLVVNAGSSFNVTVTALDPFSNTATGYTGTVHFASSDAAATLPADSTLTNGVGIFAVTLATLGSQNLSATDAVNSLTVSSNAITVSPVATHFAVSLQKTTTAGAGFAFTVTALGANNQVALAYFGTVHFTSSAALANLPADATLTSGVGTFSAILFTAGNQTLTATDKVNSTVVGTSTPFSVSPAAANHLVMTGAPGAVTAGTTFTVTLVAEDFFDNMVTSFIGPVQFETSDNHAIVQGNSTLTGGVGTFAVTLKTAGTQELFVEDPAASSAALVSDTVTVGAAAPSSYALTLPSFAVAGYPVNLTMTVQDQFGNTVPAYKGTVHFTSSDAAATLPGDSTLTNGVGVFAVTFQTTGNQTVTATDSASSSITGASNSIPISTLATHLAISAPTTTTAGTSALFTVTALDATNDVALYYASYFQFTSSDHTAVLPVNSNTFLKNGVGTFTVLFKTAGNQTLTAVSTANASIAGTSNTITVSPGTATQFKVTGLPAFFAAGVKFSFTVTAFDQYGNFTPGYSGTVAFTSNDSQALLPATGTMTNGLGVYQRHVQNGG